MILLYIYLIVLILLYVFLQLNYLFVWFEILSIFNNAVESLFLGLLLCIIWPLTISFYLLFPLTLYMEDTHNKHKNK